MKQRPGQPSPKEYWLITGRWIEVKEAQLITAPGQTQPQSFAEAVVRNEVIDMHPLNYAVGMLNPASGRKDFVVLWGIQITRQRYESVIDANAAEKQRVEAEQRAKEEAENAKPN